MPIEFWSCYDKIKKCIVDYSIYKEIIQKYPEREKDFSVIRKVSCVYNASIIDGIPEYKSKLKEENLPTEKYISNIIKNIKVSYKEEGEKSYYNYETDQIVLPPSRTFDDKYSYYATQLHELCHASGSNKRLNRCIENKYGTKDYAKEELIAEIGSSFLMSNLNVEVKKKHYDNHKGYIQSWIEAYGSWIETFPYTPGTIFPPAGGSENDVDYQWKGLQVAERVLSQVDIMPYFIHSTNFTPEWLSTFLVAFEKEVECIRLNYYQSGNILISQYQAVATAGMLMPEFKNAVIMADDSGLEIDYLNKEPGIYSARYMGEDTSYEIKNQTIISRVNEAAGDDRSARFVCNIAAVLPDGSVVHTEETMEGIIAEKAAGNGGFGYDPILFLPEFGVTSAEITMEQKNRISHRGKALEAMKRKLEEIYKGDVR